jgi:uncharacterized membrane protein (UPF0127 family)/predicted small secreted protein
VTIRLLVVLCALVVAACSGTADLGSDAESAAGSDDTVGTDERPQPSDGGRLQPSEGFDVSEVTFTDGDRRVAMPVLVADSRPLRATGLMFRTELPADAGMLFVYDEPVAGGFWMKNTLLPLTIAFVGQDGTVQQLIDMEPCDVEPCPSYAPDAPYVQAVEANQGYFEAQGIAPGWTMEVGRPGGDGA